MNLVFSGIAKIFGIKVIFEYVWRILKPKLEEWAKSDGKDDWDDEAVRVFDDIMKKISKEL